MADEPSQYDELWSQLSTRQRLEQKRREFAARRSRAWRRNLRWVLLMVALAAIVRLLK